MNWMRHDTLFILIDKEPVSMAMTLGGTALGIDENDYIIQICKPDGISINLTYNENEEIQTYSDTDGNWWDKDAFKTPCPYNGVRDFITMSAKTDILFRNMIGGKVVAEVKDTDKNRFLLSQIKSNGVLMLVCQENEVSRRVFLGTVARYEVKDDKLKFNMYF